MCVCGVETIAVPTPGGRIVDIEPHHYWIGPDSEWPAAGVFTLMVKANEDTNTAIGFVAVPAIERWDRTPGKPAGPFRREHQCAAVTASLSC